MKKSHLISIIVVAATILIVVAFRFLPAKYITGTLGKDNTLSSLACSYPVRVAGDAMSPHFRNGQLVFFSKCFEEADLGVNKIIMFKDRDMSRLGVISKIKRLEQGVVYEIIQPNRPDRISEATKNQIIAVYK
jgi:hypothetical protein